MEAKELRIGNIVDINGNRFETAEVKSDGILYYKGIVEWFARYEDIQPIPLTEELLLKAGFYYSGDSRYDPNVEYAEQFEYRLDLGLFHRDLICTPFKGWVCNFDCHEYEGKLQPIKYLHQLQNLYFALTGEELEIKF